MWILQLLPRMRTTIVVSDTVSASKAPNFLSAAGGESNASRHEGEKTRWCVEGGWRGVHLLIINRPINYYQYNPERRREAHLVIVDPPATHCSA